MTFSKKPTALTIILIAAVFCIATFAFFFVLKPAWLIAFPPQRNFCLKTNDDYRCIVSKAIEQKDASVCFYLDAGSSDRCADEVIDAVRDPAICNTIPEWGVKNDCKQRLGVK